MLWICGADALVRSLALATGWPVLAALARQMHHAGWTGFRFYDLIFPLFLFLSGMTIPYALGKRIDSGVARSKVFRACANRMIVLGLLGIVYNGGLQLKPLEATRVFSVLGLIGTGWFIAATLFLFAGRRGRVLWAAGILIGYWLVLEFFPVPGHGAGIHTPEGGVAGWVDRFMPWRLYTPSYDPEGMLPCMASGFVALAGCCTGDFLKHGGASPLRKCGLIAVAGLLALGLGWLAGFSMPLSKPQWNPPFMLTCVGCSLLMFALFFLVFDVARWRKAAIPFVVVGMNSITIYLLLRVVPMDEVAGFFFGGLVRHTAASWQPVFESLAFMLTWWGLLYFLYRRQWFLRV